MPHVRLAGPLLEESHMNDHNTPQPEPMVDAKQAAAALRLPYYWFADPAMRQRYRIPHYQIGALIRYRLSELSIWMANSNLNQDGGSDTVDEAQ